MKAEHTVLVVDDDDCREVLSELLRDEGFNVLAAPDGAGARDLLESRTVDLVLLDIVMPRTSGLELLSELRRRYSPADLPVVMMSSKDQSADVVDALERGANDYVTKPLDLPVLLARIHAQLRLRQGGRSHSERLLEVVTGSVLEGRYRLEERLGVGNFSVVFRATDLESGRGVAVKVLRNTLGEPEIGIARMQREGVAGRRLEHPSAVAIHDFRITAAGTAYLVMELLEGQTLDLQLRDRGPQAPERCCEILFPICELLAQAHAMGIVHRDIKPGNIFLHQQGGEEVVKVLDFGIAKPLSDAALERNLTLDGTILGSPAYMAPERLRNRPFDGRADVYSLGIMLYEMLAGRLPFTAANNDPMSVVAMHLNERPEPLTRWRPDLPPAVDAVVAGALDKDCRRRPWAPELARSFAAAVGVPVPAGLTPDHLKTLRFEAMP
jgi:CheY-like chemotaxis protein